MHMADALVAPAVAGTMYLLSAGAGGYSIKRVKLEDEGKKIPVMGVMGAFVFAAQMLNFTLPGTGSSGHLCGGMMLSAILGPFAGFLTMIGILAIQCLFFADGGLLALGCNIWNMAFYGCFVGALLIWKPMMKKGATFASGVTELPFPVFLAAMQPIHLLIGLVEGLITAAVLCFVYEARPELLWGIGEEGGAGGKISYKKTLGILGITALFLGGVVSLFASAFPDGLEWSLEKVAGTAEFSAEGAAHHAAEKIQEFTAFLPDYGIKNSETALGTSLSGVVGALLVAAFCFLLCQVFKFVKRKRVNE